MEVREYDEQDGKIISMFMQKQDTYKTDAILTAVCKTQTYSIKKGILKYGT